MTKILVLYYSMYGHIEQMAHAAAEGVGTVDGVEVTVKRVPELIPEDAARQAGVKWEQRAPIASPSELVDYDAIMIGTPTRYGSLCSQMQNFIDQTGGLWAKGALVGKVGSAFTSTASQHGGQETTLVNAITTFMHLGMVAVGLPYSYPGLVGVDEVKGGTPYGASTIADGDGSRQPTEVELEGARFQGRHVALITKKLHG